MKSKQIGSNRYFTFNEFKETVGATNGITSVENYINEPR